MAVRQSYSSPVLIRWGPVIAGTILGFALMVLLSSFWVALGGNVNAISSNIHWYNFASAVVALFVAGLIAGLLSGIKSTGHGIFHGLTAWGLVLAAATLFPFPAAFGLFSVFTTPLPEIGTGPAWASFFALLIGLVAAAIGGAIGGALTRTPVADEQEIHHTRTTTTPGAEHQTRESVSAESGRTE
ncbi:hypothetical protein [Haloechinothrix salitolerans]|uniref:Uncharacterized protein n=1 Tax=Haloechinothrix salitolerans TaxID=926830 RepID=A0ABW2C4C4_9PSEU